MESGVPDLARTLLRGGGAGGVGGSDGVGVSVVYAGLTASARPGRREAPHPSPPPSHCRKPPSIPPSPFAPSLPTMNDRPVFTRNQPLQHCYYEFTTDKDAVADAAGALVTTPWTIRVEGLCSKPATLDLDDLAKLAPLEDRVYRHRCVERWSMVIPWAWLLPLASLLDRVQLRRRRLRGSSPVSDVVRSNADAGAD